MKRTYFIIALSVLLLFVAGTDLFAQPRAKVATVQFTSNVRPIHAQDTRFLRHLLDRRTTRAREERR